MRRAKRILLNAGVLLLCASAAQAGWWGSKKSAKPAEAAAPSAMTLTSIEVDGARVVLRTSGAPAYTSYSPSPGVFVVDLTGANRESGISIPATLPPAVTSISADDIVEMGSHLTRITFRLAETVHPEVSAIEKAVVVTIPATTVAVETQTETPAPAPVEALPVVVPAPEPVVTEAPIVEEPVVKAEAAPLPRARTVRQVGATTAGGAVEVRIAADGVLKYKAFRLENPSRLVIDLDGVKNAASKNAVTVDDDVVKRVRVAQFQAAPPVARVVIDLARKAEYTIHEDGDALRVAFGDGPKPVAAPIVEKAPEKVAEKKSAPADIPSQVPVIADNAPVWKVPAQPEPASKGARSVISAPRDQAPTPQQPPTTTTNEDVFDEAPLSQTPAVAAQTLSGTRTLSTGPRVFTGEPISLNLKDADLKDVLRTFADLTGLNIAIDPGVGGSVTVDFVDVPWDQALDIILRQNGLTFMLEGNVMRIGTIARIAEETAATRRLAEEERLNVP
ncbi:MAG TPA: AMIN domain-containing protein, partial [Vicinamibacterales bacterium]|nr:AMIN domain-containing protein [Vicinamibacterales bacterium]